MFAKLIKKMSHSPKLSEIAQIAAHVSGTKVLDVRPATLRKYGQNVNRMIEFFGDDLPVESVTRAQYAAFHDWLATRGSEPITVNSYRRQMRAIWNRLRERGINVCDIAGITKDEILPEQEGRAITDENLTKILQIASVRDTAVLLYTIGAGFRRQSIPRLTIRDTFIWQGQDGCFRIAGKIPVEKTSPARLVMAGHKAALAVKLWLETRQFQDSPWLFYDMWDGTQLADETVTEIFRTLRRRANIPAHENVTCHSLRHRFAQDMLDGHDQKIVSQWMGISIETMLKVYAHRSADRLVASRFGDDDYPKELLMR